jgi:hypothetical protein
MLRKVLSRQNSRCEPLELTGGTVASIVTWEGDEFGILIDYGKGEWRKYRVGTRAEAIKELERLISYKRARCRIGTLAWWLR